MIRSPARLVACSVAMALGSTLLGAETSPNVSAASTAPASDPKTLVLAVVNGFFDAYSRQDADAVRRLFVPGAQVSVAPRAGQTTPGVRQRPIEQDLDRMLTNRDRMLERGWNPVVHIDGPIAVAWVPYDFHRNGSFSHNGIDVFVLMRMEDGTWRIANLAYSVEPGGTTRHPDGPPPVTKAP